MKSNHIKQLITLTVITLSSFNWTKLWCTKNSRKLKLYYHLPYPCTFSPSWEKKRAPRQNFEINLGWIWVRISQLLWPTSQVIYWTHIFNTFCFCNKERQIWFLFCFQVRLFAQGPKAKFLVSVGCCYMRLKDNFPLNGDIFKSTLNDVSESTQTEKPNHKEYFLLAVKN